MLGLDHSNASFFTVSNICLAAVFMAACTVPARSLSTCLLLDQGTSSSFDAGTGNSSAGGGDGLTLVGMKDNGRLPGGGPGGGRRPGGERPPAVGVAWGV